MNLQNRTAIVTGAGSGLGPYGASKHGVVGLTKTIALDYAEQGIRANAVGPGYIKIELVNHFPPEQRARLLEIANKCPVHRTLRSEIAIRTRLVEDRKAE